jgi:2,3-bisphosphoglycerate-independent phosphoglycerate mutase
MPNVDQNSMPVALVILDGWGYAPRTDGNAIAIAHTPNYDDICRRFPMTTLTAAGERIGQWIGEPGDSEVGHLSIGTGRVSQTEPARIQESIRSGEFLDNPILGRAFDRAKAKGSAVHLIGLISDGGVHSSMESVFALLRSAKQRGLTEIFIHCILDGVDVSERTADIYVEALEIKLADIGVGKIASLIGRFFAMDDTGKWERTARAFTMLVHSEGERVLDAVTGIRNSFLRGISDEFIAPMVVEDALGAPVGLVKDGDLVVFFNQRGDAMRQLVRSICVPEGVSGAKPDVDTVCLTEYDRSFNLPSAFRQEPPPNTLVEILSERDIVNVKITEPARSTHLSHCFDGGREPQFAVEHQVIVSPNKDAMAGFPEGQSFRITESLLRAMESNPGGVYIVNLPAAELMAETGDLQRTVAAIQFLDTCLGGIRDKIEELGGTLIVTSSHGNCENLIDAESGEPDVGATANPVPFHLVGPAATGIRLRDGGTIADIAPTVLGLLQIPCPADMTGTDLRAY